MLIMNSDMATRSNAQGKKIGDRSTAFQLHKSQLILSTGKNVIDFSEYRLKMFVQKITDEQQKQTIIDIIKQYCKGTVAIAWKEGKPVWVHVTKD